jgi:alkanesulfonate monooxygenase SsuD/methylene tetrahydromethanopterin reductase-like flavin-dependent oxidoreductase (luciferase family)
MKASFLCGVHYEGVEAHLQEGWPRPPSLFDRDIGQRTYDNFLEYAALADDLGFDWISVSEHHYSPLILTPSLGPLAGALTQVTRRAKIALFGPLAPVNNPVRTAEEIAMLDHLSHGRLIVLPLRGTIQEFNCYVPVDPLATQPMTREATLLIQKALREDQPFSWAGEYFQFPTVAVWPRPVQRPFPPMFYSGNSVESAKFAGAQRLGLCFSFHKPERVAEVVEVYRTEAATVGFEPTTDQIVYRGFIVVADTTDEAAELAASFVPAPLARSIAANQRRQLGIDGQAPAPETTAVGYGFGRLQFAGTPDAVIEQIRAFQETTGVGVLDLIFTGGVTPPAAVRRSIELFGQEVLPRIRAIGESVVSSQSPLDH